MASSPPADLFAAPARLTAADKLWRLAWADGGWDPARDPWFGPGGLARPDQLPPPGDWRTWLVMAGRGFGKTRLCAEFIRREVACGRMRRIAFVGTDAGSVRDVMVEGKSGIVPVCEQAGVWARYEPSRRRITFWNGAHAYLYSAERPDSLRGPEHDGAWADEFAAWKYPEAWDNLQFGLRIGPNPRQVAATTPRPIKSVRDLLAQPTTVVTRGSTFANRANLAPAFVSQIVKRYEGTRLGRQELYGEVLDDTPGALWTPGLLDEHRVAPEAVAAGGLHLARVVVGVDPAASTTEGASETGIVVAGIDRDGFGWVLDDRSTLGTPLEWASAVVRAHDDWQADRVVAEANNGGLMVLQTLQTVRPALPVTLVHAARGKIARAEPIAALYEQGRVHHLGVFPALEDQMTTYSGLPGEASPDRLDSLVWALSALMVRTAPAGIDPALAAAFVGLPGRER